MPRIFLWICVLGQLGTFSGSAAESWESALARMPLRTAVHQLNQTNCVELMLRDFQSNSTVKTLIFMPGATDEFYMFHRARAELTNESPTLLDAVIALTNQTLIRATYFPSMLLLHSDEDPVEPLNQISSDSMAKRIQQRQFIGHILFVDRDWDFVQPILKKQLHAEVLPWRYTYDSWHFYRHSLAGWNLTGWEALEAISLAGKTRFSVGKSGLFFLARPRIVFEGDTRVRAVPRIESPKK